MRLMMVGKSRHLRGRLEEVASGPRQTFRHQVLRDAVGERIQFFELSSIFLIVMKETPTLTTPPIAIIAN